jgi:hypothetical protein
MIRRPLPDGELLVPQHEHALLAGRLAARHRDLPEPREAFVRAVALHDAGWPLFDDRPEPLADGRAPHVFDLPHGASAPAWRRSIAIARTFGPLEALLVSRHFSRFSDEFAAEQAPLQAAWRLGVASEAEEAGVALVGYCDSLSLRLICEPAEPISLPSGTKFDDGGLDPWPFAEPEVEDAVVGRFLPTRRWASVAEFQAAYAAAAPLRLAIRLRPLVSK